MCPLLDARQSPPRLNRKENDAATDCRRDCRCAPGHARNSIRSLPCIRKSTSQQFPSFYSLPVPPHLSNGTRLGCGKWIGRMIERASKCRSRRIKLSPSSRVVRQGVIKGGDEKLVKKTGRAISSRISRNALRPLRRNFARTIVVS